MKGGVISEAFVFPGVYCVFLSERQTQAKRHYEVDSVILMNREAHVDKDDDDAIGNINNQQFRLNRGSIVKWMSELLLFCVI